MRGRITGQQRGDLALRARRPQPDKQPGHGARVVEARRDPSHSATTKSWPRQRHRRRRIAKEHDRTPAGDAPSGSQAATWVPRGWQVRSLIGHWPDAAEARGVQWGRPVETSSDVEDRIVTLYRRRQLTARAIARLLEDEGLPAPRGGTRWHHGTVADIIRRRGGRLKPGRPRKGAAAQKACGLARCCVAGDQPKLGDKPRGRDHHRPIQSMQPQAYWFG